MSISKTYQSPLNNPNSLFYQTNAEGKRELTHVRPRVPVGHFEFPEVNGSVSAVFHKHLENGKEQFHELRPLAPYIPSDEIVETVRLAQILRRPILIKGEPGSGKTQLAQAVAYEWYGNNFKQHFFEWYVKSTSKATDGLYSFDHVERLRQAQLAKFREKPGKEETGVEANKTKYREFGPMGMAFLTSTETSPSILLIDEIDKADIDFPNDLLLELDQNRFEIPDSLTGEKIVATHSPLIFITSNDERELPEAFLRRCLFLYIKFPQHDQLRAIVKAHLPDLVAQQQALVEPLRSIIDNPRDLIDLAILQFGKLKDERANDPADNKRVSTSELLDWLRAVDYDWKHTTGQYATIKSELEKYIRDQRSNPESAIALESMSIGNNPFYHQTVLKSWAAVVKRNPTSVNPK